MLIIPLPTVLKIPHECEWNIFVLFHWSHKINWYVSRKTLIRLRSFVIIDHSYICQKLSKSLPCITNKVTHIFPNSEFLFVLVRSTLLCFMHWLFEIISCQYDSIDSDDTSLTNCNDYQDYMKFWKKNQLRHRLCTERSKLIDQEKLRPFGQWFRIESSRKQAIRHSRTLGGDENKFSRNRSSLWQERVWRKSKFYGQIMPYGKHTQLQSRIFFMIPHKRSVGFIFEKNLHCHETVDIVSLC